MSNGFSNCYEDWLKKTQAERDIIQAKILGLRTDEVLDEDHSAITNTASDGIAPPLGESQYIPNPRNCLFVNPATDWYTSAKAHADAVEGYINLDLSGLTEDEWFDQIRDCANNVYTYDSLMTSSTEDISYDPMSVDSYSSDSEDTPTPDQCDWNS